MSIKAKIKKLLPKQVLLAYHLALAWLGAVIYGFPSHKMVIIGVTGTRGKTTTSNFIWSALTSAGYKVGQTGTANIRIGNVERLNPYHMTMPGRFRMQKMLAEMAEAGCEIAIVETPSEGVEQFRHKGIAYDMLVFTVLYPEHLAIHNWDPERCTQKMIEPFTTLMAQPKKSLRGQPISKMIFVNHDSNGFERFLNNPAEKKITFGLNNGATLRAEEIVPAETGVSFKIENKTFNLSFPGEYNVVNALPAIAIGRSLGINDSDIATGLAGLNLIPGRMEKIVAGQNFSVYVDYAHDGPSIKALLLSSRGMRHEGKKIIIAIGAEGGGRDKEKRPVMGGLCAELSDYTVITNVDPYEDDPKPILNDIAMGSYKAGGKENQNIFVIEDRREGIKKALSLANQGDIVLITGKGAEQTMELGEKSIPWDDRAVVREELGKML